MRPADDHRRFEEDLAAYVLDGLDDADRIGFEAHLDQCKRCRSDLGRLRPAVGDLATSVPQLEPSRRLRRRTLAAAREDQRQTGPRRSALPIRPRIAAVGAAVAAIAIVAIGIASAGRDSGPGSTTVPVQAANAAANGTLVVRDDTAILEVDRMPRLPASQVYEAWIERGGQVEPSSTFIVDRHGAGAATIPGVDGAERVMVTREPRGGSNRPSTVPLLEAPL